MYGLVDENGEYDEEAVQALQEQLAESAGPAEEARDSTVRAPADREHARAARARA